MTAKTVFVFLRSGILVRNFVNADLLAVLERSGHRFVIFAPEPDHPFLKLHFREPHFTLARMNVEAGYKALTGSRLRSFLTQVRRFTFGNTTFSENGCRQSLIVALEREQIAAATAVGRIYYRSILWTARVASWAKWARKLVQWLEGYLFPFDGHADHYRRHKPSMTIVTSLGFDLDTLVMREARHFGADVTVLVKNWDVPTTRGIGGEVPDHVLVWNEIMRREVVRYHDVPENRVSITGISQWDSYFRTDAAVGTREQFFDRYGLSSARRTIYFAMTTPSHYKHNLMLARLLLEMIRDGRFCHPVQLLIRLHPAYVLINGMLNEVARDELEELQREFGSFLAYSRPSSEDWNGFLIPGDSNDTDLKEILAYSDVMVTVYSTQILEGTMFDLPIVNAGMFSFRDTGLPVATYEDWDHIRQVLDREAIAYCYDMDEVVAATNAALDERSRGSAARKRIADEQFPISLRGRAGEVTAQRLIELIDQKAAH